MTAAPLPPIVELANGAKVQIGGMFKLVYQQELLQIAGPVRGYTSADRRAAQLIREAWNKLPDTPSLGDIAFDAAGIALFSTEKAADVAAEEQVRSEQRERANTPPSVRSQALEEAIKEIQQEILDKDDRTSPEEYPDMVLITLNEIAAYLRYVAALSLRAPDAGWKTIDSAPKDETPLDLWIVGDDGGPLRIPDVQWKFGGWQMYSDKWGWMPAEARGCRATHWRPLPAPPVGDGSSLA